jgi:hypothetical protein
MRRIALCATLALTTACLIATTALADGPTTVTVDSHVTPVIRAFTPRTTASTLAINLKFNGSNGENAATLKNAILKFTYGARLMGRFFPSCSADQIRNHKPCPRGSVIGSGKALGRVGSGPTAALEDIDVTLYNGPKGKSITFRIQGKQPAPIDVPFDAPLKTFKSGNYNFEIDVPVPDILQRIAGLPISLDFFNVKVGATTKVKRKKVGYIETLICPPLALVALQGHFDFVDADPYNIDTYIHCGA